MRNLKKFLALVLAMMMVFSLMVTVNAADFADADDVSPAYAEAVEVLAGIGVIEGDSHDELTPQSGFTRAHLATVAYRVGTGSVADNTEVELYRAPGQFDDVRENHWANPYINFAYNAEWVHGINEAQTLYNPGGEVTGYQALALLLQILQYGKQGEFLGRNWQIEAARYGKEAGLTKGLLNTTLTKAATREEVFQMMFNALKADIVKYSADAKGYESTGETLGEKYFGLASVDSTDKWGRPVVTWFQDKDKDGEKDANEKVYVDFMYPLVAYFEVAMDECDVVHEFDLADDDVVEYWLNGVKMELEDEDDDLYANVSYRTLTDGHNDLDGLHVGYTIGGQGVKTEIYLVDGGYHVVQANTWLARVDAVTVAKVDKHDHKGLDTIDFTVFDCVEDRGAKEGDYDESGDCDHCTEVEDYAVNASYTKGQYILVNQCAGKYQVVGAAPVIRTGELTDYTDADYPDPATHIFDDDEDEYETDAVMFYLNWHEISDKSWAVYGDNMGNAIGLAENVIPDDYAVITAIVWNHNGLKGGYASATLILDDGTETDEVTISKINGTSPTNAEVRVTSATSFPAVADNVNNNPAYLYHIFSYIENEDGTYNIYTTNHRNNLGVPTAIPDADPDNNIVDIGFGSATYDFGVIYQEEGNIYGWKDDVADGKVNASDDTVVRVSRGTDETTYLVWNSKNRAYDIYNGKDEVPDVIGDICVVEDAYGFAILVVVSNVQDTSSPSNVIVAYIANLTSTTGRNIGGTHYNAYKVYALGSTTATTLYDDDAFTSMSAVTETGLYEITYDEDTNIITSITATTSGTDYIGDDAQVAYAGAWNPTVNDGYLFANVMANAPVVGRTLYTGTWTGTIHDGDAAYGADGQNFDLDAPETTYIVVNKQPTSGSYPAAGPATLEKGSKSDIEKGSILIVGYAKKGDRNIAAYVYIIKCERAPVTGGTTTQTAYEFDMDNTSITYTSGSLDIAAQVKTKAASTYFAQGAKVTFGATLQMFNVATGKWEDVADGTSSFEAAAVANGTTASVAADDTELDIVANLSKSFQYQVVLTAKIGKTTIATRTILVANDA